MAKIPRYIAGQTNVGMLEQGKAALQSPEQAAAAAAAPYETVSDISVIAGSALDAYSKVKEATQLADDELLMTRTATETNTLIQKEYNDALEFGYSADELEEKIATHINNMGSVLDKLQHRKSKQNAPENIKLTQESLLEKHRSEIRKYAVTKITDEHNAQWNVAKENKDIPTMMHLRTMAENLGISGEADLAAMEIEINQVMLEEDAINVSSGVETAYLTGGKEAGEKAYDDLVRRTDIPEDVKKQALLQAQVHRSNFFRSQEDEKNREKAIITRTTTVNSENAKIGEFSEAENELALSNGDYGDPESSEALTSWATVYRDIRGFQRSAKLTVDVTSAVENKTILDPSKENRKALDGYMQNQVDVTGIEVDSEEYFRLVSNVAQTVGVLPERERIALNGGFVSKEQAQQYLPLWNLLRDNDLLRPSLGLSDEADTMYVSMSNLVEYGATPLNASETVWNARPTSKGGNLTPADAEALGLDYAEQTDAATEFNKLKNSKFYDDADPWFAFTFGPETETKMATRYAEVRKEVYFATGGNIDAANNAAEQAIKNGWGVSNFGNADPDNYTIQENPFGKDMSEFQEVIISNINNMKVEGWENLPASKAGVTFNVFDGSEYKEVKALDKEKVTFYEVPQLEENRRDGVRRFQVWHEGRPIVNTTTGRVLDFAIDEATAKNIGRVSEMKTIRADEVDSINDRIAEIEEQLKVQEKVKSPYVNRGELKAELEGLKRSLPAAKKRKDEMLYAPYAMFPGSQLPEVID